MAEQSPTAKKHDPPPAQAAPGVEHVTTAASPAASVDASLCPTGEVEHAVSNPKATTLEKIVFAAIMGRVYLNASRSSVARSPDASRAARRIRRGQQRCEWDAQRVRDAHERVQRDVASAFELRNPLERRAELHAELLLREPALFAQLGDTPAHVQTYTLGIDGPHRTTVPVADRTINKVVT